MNEKKHSDILIKRLIGMPGDTVECEGGAAGIGTVSINTISLAPQSRRRSTAGPESRPCVATSEQWAAKLGGLPLAFIHKTRDTTRPNHAVAHGIIGDVKGRDCVVIDDMIDTAGTITEAVRTLHEHGASAPARCGKSLYYA